jgi:hypothetical protein
MCRKETYKYTGMHKLIMYLIPIVMALSSCNGEDGPEKITRTFDFDFEEGLQGWDSIFADYPKGENQSLELHLSHSSLPEPLNTDQKAVKISGLNLSDDLFMGLLRKIDGLTSGTVYSIIFHLTIASNAPQNSIGIGGSPGASVYLKVGAVPDKPELITDELQWLRLSIDKGNQAAGGADMINVGTIGTSLDEFIYTIIKRSNTDKPFTVMSNDLGEIWLLVGTDSGFEGSTTLYYDRIEVEVY